MTTTARRIATVEDEFNMPLGERTLFQIGLLARTAPGAFEPDRILFVEGDRIRSGQLVDCDADVFLEFTITGFGVMSDDVWKPLPSDD